MPDERILLIEPDPRRQLLISSSLFRSGFQVTATTDIPTALAEMRRKEPEGIVFDIGDPPRHTNEILTALRKQSATVPILALVTPEHVAVAVELLESEVEDFVLRPPQALELATRLRRMLERHELKSRVDYYQMQAARKGGFRDDEVLSKSMQRLVEQAQRVAPIRATVLITGESGVGKELIARELHRRSPRCEMPFIALNCAAMPTTLIESELFGHEKGAFTGAHTRVRGKFELADGGTIFLDEIGEMEISTQAKLLRILEQKDFMRLGGDQNLAVDVRLIAATNANLDQQVREGAFRRDLYYRLKVIQLRVPPLRERRADLPALVTRFLEELARANAVPSKTMDPAAMKRLERYNWPGNVRELKNLIESLLVSARDSVIGTDDLPPSVSGDAAPLERRELAGLTLEEVERELLRQTLEKFGGNRTHTARALGIGVRTLQRKILSYQLDIAPRRRGTLKHLSR